MDSKNKKVISILVVCLAAISMLTGCGKDFDASGYVSSVLDVTFQDETEQALSMIDGVTANDLHQQHEDSIRTFVENNITNEISMNELKEARFFDLCEKIFATMRYDAKDAEKTGKKQYEVPVEISPSDVFIRFQEALVTDSEEIAADVQAGKYTGTEEEIAQQVLNDIVNRAYELLDVAYLDMEFGREQTVILTVEANEENEYSINQDDMDNLIVKILRLDEIQD